jgi:hypothetical protein
MTKTNPKHKSAEAKKAARAAKLGGEVRWGGYRLLHLFVVFLVCIRLWELVGDSKMLRFGVIVMISVISFVRPAWILG